MRLKPGLALRLLSKGLFYIRAMPKTLQRHTAADWADELRKLCGIFFLQSREAKLYDFELINHLLCKVLSTKFLSYYKEIYTIRVPL